MDMPKNGVATNSQPLTTFVKVDTNTFKEVVQRLTGSSQAATTLKENIGIKKPAFKLHERRQYKAKLEIIKPPLDFKQGTAALQRHFSPEQEGFSPSRSGYGVLKSSPLNTPTKCFASLSLGESESGGKSLGTDLNIEEEEKAIRERRFYLHPSPRSRPQFDEPQLLSLFPLTSPKLGEEV